MDPTTLDIARGHVRRYNAWKKSGQSERDWRRVYGDLAEVDIYEDLAATLGALMTELDKK